MQRTTDVAAPIKRTRVTRQQIASLAHATAHEVAALRAAKARLAKASVQSDDFIQSVALAELEDMIREREIRIAMMADEVAGHA